MTCPLCTHPRVAEIDRALKERTLTMAAGGKEAAHTFEEMAVAFNQVAEFEPPITVTQLKVHISCPPQEHEIITVEDALPSHMTDSVMINGERVPVYSPGETVRIICAAGVKNILAHPEQVKVGHIIQIMKLTGDLRRSDDLVDLLKNLIENPTMAPAGPQSPPAG